MIALDCETFDSALHSSAAILSLQPGDLRKTLLSFQFDSLPISQRRTYSYKDLLLMYVLGALDEPKPPPTPSVTHWFHATRVAPGTTFEQGILPLSRIVDGIWDFLGKLASEWTPVKEWDHFRRNMRGEGALQYGLKVGSMIGQGPFGFLVRPIIFCPEEMGNHDYLGIPEIVEDICNSYEEMFQRPLREAYMNATRGCIVKFRAEDSRPDTVGAALMYLHCEVQGKDPWDQCNTCYDGEGSTVSREAILGIEWP
jgi:hypothetical protein